MPSQFATLPAQNTPPMRKTLLVLLVVSLATACQHDLFSTHFRSGGGRPPKRPPSPELLPEGMAVWATAVSFHDTTDWRAGETGGAGLLLFKNGVRVDSLPAKDCLQPAQHRFREGYLWTNATDGTHTFIRRDGEPWLSYEGEETLSGFLIQNGRIHTLGQRPGGGFCYRIDGKAVYASARGLVLGSADDPDWEGGALTSDGGIVCYTVGLAQQSADTPVWEYRLMRGNDIWKVITPPADAQLFDVRVCGGVCYRLELRYDRYCLIGDEEVRVLQGRGEQGDLKLIPTDEGIAATGNSLLGPARMGWVEEADGRYQQYLYLGGGKLRLSFRGGVLTILLFTPEETLSGVRIGSQLISFPEGVYRLKYGRCALPCNGTLALALTAANGDRHCLWVAGTGQEVRFNGYFTGIYIE